MKTLKRIFNVLLITVFTVTGAFADTNCNNKYYRRAYPERCKSNNNSTFLALAGGAALAGVGIALVANASGDNGSSSTISNQSTFPRTPLSSNIVMNYAPTDYVQNRKINAVYLDSLTHGNDIDSSTINSIKSTAEYQRNFKQFDSINFAWASARDFSGKNISINIFDDFQSNHGYTVHDVLQNIAPDANIINKNLAYSEYSFESFDYIANAINQSAPSYIYNASWQIPSSPANNAANVIYNSTTNPKTYAEAQQYMYNITSENFITQIRNSAIDNDAIFVWAAGNDSQSESGALSALPIAFPDLQGHFVNVVALDNYGKIAWYSNQCGITQNYCIAAPGSGWDTNTQSYASGTSFATPVISGAIAVIKEAFPYMNATEITSLLFTTAQDLGTPGIDSVYGWGLLDMEKATNPIGTPRIIFANDNIQPLTLTNIGGIAAPAIQKANIKIAFIDDFGRAFTTNLSNNIKLIPYGRGFDKLREHDNNHVVMFDRFEFGTKQNHLLESSGILSVQQNHLTNFVGYKNEFSFDDVIFYQKADIGITSLDTDKNSLVSGFSNIYTASLDAGIKWHDLSLEFAIPETIISGNMYMTIPTGRAEDGRIIYNHTNIDLVDTNIVTEYSIKYKNLSATYVNNQNYQDEFFIMAKTNFAF